MKKNLLIIAAIFSITFFSCTKDEITITEEEGAIPGMGNAGGDVEIAEAFVLPEGIELLSVTGMTPDEIDVELSSANLKSGRSSSKWYGSGKHIQTIHRFRNTTDKPINCRIPARSVYKCDKENRFPQDIQLGTIVQDIDCEIPANSEKDCIVKLFCLNKGWSGSIAEMNYNCLGLLGSEHMKGFTDFLKDYPIGRERYQGSSDEDYNEAAEMVQEMVWCITQGTQGLDEQKKKFKNKHASWNFR